MKNIEIRFNEKSDLERITELCSAFASENCCNGIIADDIEYFSDKNIAVAILDGEIIGYGYGSFEKKQKDTSMLKAGEKSFFLDEIYVTPLYRNLGIGQKIFEFLKNYAKDNGCTAMEVCAVSKDYKKLLSFYIEKLGMNFWTANLVKRL